MSSPQPQGSPAPAARAISKAKRRPTIANVVEAIEAVHIDVQQLKGDVQQLKGDVAKLLHHFGLTSGGTP